jgi:hypothetical protein
VLARFVANADQVGAERITTDLAVAWATQPVNARPVEVPTHRGAGLCQALANAGCTHVDTAR